MAADRTQLQSWRRFVVEGEGIPAGANRPLILDSWKRPRAFEIGPCRNCSCTSAEPQELERRKALRAELLEAAVPRLLELHKTIEGSLSLITLTDGHGVVLDVMGDDEIRVMKNLPQQGSVHSERVIGTSGRETSLAIDRQGSILKTNRVAQDKLRPDSNTIGRSVSEAVPATINFACLVAEDVAALANLRFTPEELARIDEEAVEGGTNLWAQSSEAG